MLSYTKPTSGAATAGRLGRLALGASVAVLAAGIVVAAGRAGRHAPSPPEEVGISEPAPEPAPLRVLAGTIRRGRGLAESLAAAGLDRELVQTVVRHLGGVLDLRRLRPGESFAAELDAGGGLVRLTYERGPLEAVVLRAEPSGWSTEHVSLPVDTRVVEMRGRIESTLFEAVERAGEGDALTVAFAELFAWDIDFSHEMQPGDAFRAVFEKHYRDGQFLQYGRILAAEYRDSEETHRAYFFPWPEGRGDHFTPEGESVRASFLRSPISYTRISSGFSHARRHPVHKRVQPHLGVDYAAPTGTPVWAPADGTVTSMRRDRAGGNQIGLRHPGGYETFYLHLSRYASGLRTGSRVRQKQVIGYVGSTGLSTGPHLDYRVRRRGRWVNPLREQFPRAERLPERYRQMFAEYRSWLDGELTTPLPATAALPPAVRPVTP